MLKKIKTFLKNDGLAMIFAFVVLFGIVSSIVWFIHKQIIAPTKPFEEISTTTPTIKADFPQKYDQPLIIKLTDLAISILPLKANPAQAETKDNTVKYIDAYENTDIVQTKSAGKLKEDIILKQPNHPEQFQYQIDLSQYDFSRDTAGNLFFYDKGKKGNGDYLRFEIPAPFMIDADKKISSTQDVEFKLESNGLLTLKPKKDWLKNAKYPITLDPTIEITILNVHSHPAQGDNWIIDFNTQGTADLKIIPNDQATIDDDQFYSLKCNDESRTPQILTNNVIFVKDWNCNTTGQIIFYTKKAGNHTMKFQFGAETSYAFNNALPFYATGGTVTYDGGYEIHTFTATGSDTLKVTGSGLVDYLVVGGGGAGGGGYYSGGGGGGGALTGTLAVTSGNKTVTVGVGGVGNSSTVGGNGGNSVFDSVAATGGGGGGTGGVAQGPGQNGGSGGGGSSSNAEASIRVSGTGVSGQGYAGGTGYSANSRGGAGGGGAGGAGETATDVSRGFNGGAGINSSISGGSIGYAGGGGGSIGYLGTVGGTATHGGGGGSASSGAGGVNGTANTGGGGGGNAEDNAFYGGAGGSGIVIVRLIPVWPPPPVFYAVGGTVTRVGSYEIHTFTNVGTTSIAFTGSGTVNYLVVGGGGGGGIGAGGGGGAGGMRTGTLSVTSSNKNITVGAGGAGSTGATNGINGSNSVFDSITSNGGGGGGLSDSSGNSGGSGGGGGGQFTGSSAGGDSDYLSPKQGYDGGTGGYIDGYRRSGGGGGAGAVGANGASGVTGDGGIGAQSSISGVATYYAGGGGGGANDGTDYGLGGNGGGGNGGLMSSPVATNGTANTGGGGGGGSASGGTQYAGGSGGSGIIIISFIPTLPPEIVFRSAYVPSTDQYTKLLLHTDGTNGSTTFTDSETTPKTVTANGNAQISTAQSKFNGSSGYFDGTGDYLSVPDSEDFNFGSGDFTIDFWVNPGQVSAQKAIFSQEESDYYPANFAEITTGQIRWVMRTAAGADIFDMSSSSTLTIGTWYHVALVKNGTTYKIYINGTERGSATNSTVMENVVSPFEIGRRFDGACGLPSCHWNGYIDELRISKGIARWTSNFTPPTSPYSSTGVSGLPTIFRTAATDQYTRLLLHSDGSGSAFVDSESRPKTITANGDATQSSSQSKFGGKSAYFSGTNGELTLADSDDWNIGSGDFSIDFWIYPNSFTNYQTIFAQSPANAHAPILIQTWADGHLHLYASSNNSSWNVISNGDLGAISLNTWSHVALVRSGNNIYGFVNGTNALTADVTGITLFNSTALLCIGNHGSGGDQYFRGYLDEFRWSKGIARWTSNFTPPTSAYTSTGSDVILK